MTELTAPPPAPTEAPGPPDGSPNGLADVLAANRAIAAIPHLDRLLEGHGRIVVGWGRKRSGRVAERLAARTGRRLLLLEDGFLRCDLRRAPPQSLLLDGIGVHYDATRPSRMEQVIAAPPGAAEAARALAIARLWAASGVSKYNHAPDFGGELPAHYVLVADQTAGDPAIRLGLADRARFETMLEAALGDYPGHTVLLKTHPDVFSHGKHRNFTPRLLSHPRIRVIDRECHPARLLDQADAVYVVTSLIGFEALLRGKPVRCFGMPFYAGWGVTTDYLPRPDRRGTAGLAQIVHAALVDRARYIDPASGTPTSVETSIARIGAWRRSGGHLAATANVPPRGLLKRLGGWWAR